MDGSLYVSTLQRKIIYQENTSKAAKLNPECDASRESASSLLLSLSLWSVSPCNKPIRILLPSLHLPLLKSIVPKTVRPSPPTQSLIYHHKLHQQTTFCWFHFPPLLIASYCQVFTSVDCVYCGNLAQLTIFMNRD